MHEAFVKVSDLMSQGSCLTIPKFQRRYDWGIENVHGLIRDIAEVATNPSSAQHWTGVIIYRQLQGDERCPIGRENYDHNCRELIDGQQRLTTIRLWIKALLDHSADLGNPINYNLTPFYLQSPNDKQFQQVVESGDVSSDRDPLSKAYSYFRYLLWLGEDSLIQPDEIATHDGRTKGTTQKERWENHLIKMNSKGEKIPKSSPPDCKMLLESTLSKISFLAISLEATEDAERIFSALNGNRTELTAFDHFRNFSFSKISPADRDKVFTASWSPAEKEFESMKTTKSVSPETLKAKFFYDFLISIGEGQFGKFNISRSFTNFRKFERSDRFSQMYQTIENLASKHLHVEVALWKTQREFYSNPSLPTGKRLELSNKARRSMHRIRLASDGPPAPLLLWVLRRSILPTHDPKYFSPEECESIFLRLEGYMFKTLLAGKSLTNMRAGVISSMKNIDNKSVKSDETPASAYILETIDKWTEVRWATLRNDLLNSHRRGEDEGVYKMLKAKATLALLDAIDEEYSGARRSGFLTQDFEYNNDPFWVEHIAPQDLKKWIPDLRTWNIKEEDLRSRMHVLGNLSALPSEINIKSSNKKFSDKKKQALDSTDASGTKLQSWTDNDKWTPLMIDERTTDIIDKMIKRWPDPAN
jgi:hypothetical protein